MVKARASGHSAPFAYFPLGPFQSSTFSNAPPPQGEPGPQEGSGHVVFGPDEDQSG